MLDYFMLEDIRNADPANGISTVNELIQIFCTATPKRIEEIFSAAQTKNSSLLFERLHELKSACGFIGAQSLHQICLEMERKLSNISEQQLNDLSVEYKTIEQELKDYLVNLK